MTAAGVSTLVGAMTESEMSKIMQYMPLQSRLLQQKLGSNQSQVKVFMPYLRFLMLKIACCFEENGRYSLIYGFVKKKCKISWLET